MLSTVLQIGAEDTLPVREVLADDAATQRAIQRIARLLMSYTEATTVTLSLVDADGERCWSARGTSELADTADPGELACCRMVLSGGELLAIEDALQDPRAHADPALLAGRIRACLGVPLPGPGGEPQGVLCVLADRPRRWDSLQRASLAEWAALVAAELEHRRGALGRDRIAHALRVAEQCVSVLCKAFPTGVVLRDLSRSVLAVSPSLAARLGYADSELLGTPAMELVHPDDRLGFRALHRVALLNDRDITRTQIRYLRKDGSAFAARVRIHVIRGPGSEPRYTIDLVEQAGGGRRRKRARETVGDGELLPICSFCKKVRDSDGEWEMIESYLGARHGIALTHGLCELRQELHYGAFLQ